MSNKVKQEQEVFTLGFDQMCALVPSPQCSHQTCYPSPTRELEAPNDLNAAGGNVEAEAPVEGFEDGDVEVEPLLPTLHRDDSEFRHLDLARAKLVFSPTS